MKRFWLSFCVIFLVFGLCFSSGITLQAEEEQPEEIPTIITINTVDTFNSINETLKKNPSVTITLGRDINFAEETLIPIGTEDIKFSGVFDGEGHSLTNVNFDVSGSSANYGVFAFTNGATIKNLSVDANFIISGNVNSNLNMGAVVANAQNTEISNCKSTVKAYPKQDVEPDPTFYKSMNFGGIVGVSEGSKILNSYVLCELDMSLAGDELSKSYIGGIVGKASGGEIKQVYVAPTNDIINGVTGVVAEKENIVIKNKNASSAVSVGGIAGYVEGKNFEMINTLFIGYIKDEENILYGGLIGKINESDIYKPVSSNIINSKYFSINNSTTVPLNFAIGNSGNIAFVENVSLQKISAFPSTVNDFISESAGWNELYYWDFNNVWKNSTIYNAKGIYLPSLQQFSSLSIYLDYLTYQKYYTLNFEGETSDVTSKSFKIGDQVKIKAKFNSIDPENLELGTYESFFSFDTWRKVGDANFSRSGVADLTFICANDTAGSYYLTYVGRDVDINVNIVNENKHAGNFGSVSHSNTKHEESFTFKSRYADESAVINLQAEDIMGEYKFSHFECGEYSATNKSISFKLDNNRANSPQVEVGEFGRLVCNIYAVFSNNTSVINVNLTKDGGNISIDGFEGSLKENSEKVLINNKEYTFTASENKGYKFVGWFINNEKQSEDKTFTTTFKNSINLEARFEKVDGEGGGVNIWLIIGPIIGALVLAGLITLIVIKVKNRDKYSYKKNYKY